MGEIADMMIDGTMCPCGEFMDEGADGPGYPQYCSPQCKIDYGGGEDEPIKAEQTAGQKRRRVKCLTCGKGFRTAGARDQHRRDKHG